MDDEKEEMRKWAEKFKRELPDKIKEWGRDATLENINKNVRMLLSSKSHEHIQGAINKIREFYYSRRKKWKVDLLQLTNLFLGVLLGAFIVERQYLLVILIFGVIVLIFFIRSINIRREEKEYFEGPKYGYLLRVKDATEKHMDRLVP